MNMNGTLGEQAERVLTWAGTLEQTITAFGLTWDERLSTVSASKILLEADLSRKKRKKVIDQVAAVLILQGYLDHARSPRTMILTGRPKLLLTACLSALGAFVLLRLGCSSSHLPGPPPKDNFFKKGMSLRKGVAARTGTGSSGMITFLWP